MNSCCKMYGDDARIVWGLGRLANPVRDGMKVNKEFGHVASLVDWAQKAMCGDAVWNIVEMLSTSALFLGRYFRIHTGRSTNLLVQRNIVTAPSRSGKGKAANAWQQVQNLLATRVNVVVETDNEGGARKIKGKGT